MGNEKTQYEDPFYVFRRKWTSKNRLKSTELQLPPSEGLHTQRHYKFAIISHQNVQCKTEITIV